MQRRGACRAAAGRTMVMSLAVHTLGWCALSVALALPFLNGASWRALVEGGYRLSLPSGVLHVLSAALLWAIVWLGWRGLRRRPPARLVRRGRGTVMVETLIALPVLLMLVTGVAQLIVINAAGMLTDLATFAAGRSVWLWSGEAQRHRRGVDHRMVREKARLSAAAVLAPVAPASYRDKPAYELGLRRLIGITQGAQIRSTGNDFGPVAERTAQLMFERPAPAWSDSVARAVDLESFRERSLYKVINAYRFQHLVVLARDGDVGAELTYHHQCAFPIAARLICKADVIEGRGGYYSSIRRRFLLPAQVPVSASAPRGSRW